MTTVSTPSLKTQSFTHQWVAFAIMVLVLVIAPIWVYPIFLMKVMCFALFACAFNLLIGFGGLLSFGHAMFLGTAGYAAAHAAKVWGWNPELAVLFATGCSGLLALVTVPKLSIIVRKSYGQAYLNMGGGRNSDEVAAWPTADLGFMDPKVGASVLAREGESSEATKSKSDSLVRDTTAWGLASLYEAHTVLDPRETRGWLAAMLDVHRSKLTRGVGQHRLANWPTSY